MLMANIEAQVFYVDAQGQNKFVKKAFIDYTATKPANAVAADLTITKSEKDGTFTITAKNLQGFDGYKEVKIPFWSHANGMKRYHLVYSNSSSRWFLYCNGQSELITKMLMANTKRRSSM